MSEAYLGIDLGTSELKVAILEENGTIAVAAGESYSPSRPQHGWSEQDPESWWLALDRVMFKLMASNPLLMKMVSAIGLSGQMHGAVALDKSLNVLRPAILWNDTRSSLECNELNASGLGLTDLSGNLAMPGFTAPKLMWMAKNEPNLFEKVHKVLLPKDYLRFCMTGKLATDFSDASGTLWLDVEKRKWSENLLTLHPVGARQQQLQRGVFALHASRIARSRSALASTPLDGRALGKGLDGGRLEHHPGIVRLSKNPAGQ